MTKGGRMMDFKIGDADELADMAGGMMKKRRHELWHIV
jgi:hypothetical protein